MEIYFKYIILLIFILSSLDSFSQSIHQDRLNQNIEIKKQYKYPKPILRQREFLKQRNYNSGNNIKEKLSFSILQKKNNKLNSNLKILESIPKWNCIGPDNIGGRVKSIVYNPINTNIVYIAAASGGIWKTTNSGESWKPIFDDENAIAFGSIAIDYQNPNILYAGTGEAVMGTDIIYLGAGIYKSTNAGESWFLLGLSDAGAFSKVWVARNNSNLLYAGVVNSSQGFYKSTDAGISWKKTFDYSVSDVSYNENNEAEVYIGVNGEGIYYSSNYGETWVKKSYGLNTGIGRVSVQLAQSNTNILYSLMEINEIGFIYKSTDYGNNWFNIYQGNSSFFNEQGVYNNFIAVNPKNSDIVIAGGIDMFITTNGGTDWQNVTKSYSGGSVHMDQHHAAYNPLNTQEIIAGNDGGVYISDNGGFDWKNISSGLQITQFYSLAIDTSKQSVNYGGTQDNGMLCSSDGKWSQIVSGDGFRVIVDSEYPNMIFAEYYYGLIWKYDITNNTKSMITNGINLNENSEWNSPLVQQNNNLYTARQSIYKSTNKGINWISISPQYKGAFSALDVSQSDDNVIYAGTEFGQLIVSTNAGSSWIDVSNNGLVNRYVTDITISKNNPSKAYITFSGYNSAHIFKTTNYGASWYSISNNLPDIPCNAIIIHPEKDNVLFVATDIGVFASYNDGDSWFIYGEGLPYCPIVDLAFHSNKVIIPELTLRVASHGRSIWEIIVPDELPIYPIIVSPAGGEQYCIDADVEIIWSNFDYPVKIELSIDDGNSWTTIADNINSEKYNWKINSKTSNFARVRVSSIYNQSQNQISKPFSIVNKHKGAILKAAGLPFSMYGITFDGKKSLWVSAYNNSTIYRINCDSFIIDSSIVLEYDYIITDLDYDIENNVLLLNTMNNNDRNYIIRIDLNNNTITKKETNYYNLIGLEIIDNKLLLSENEGLLRLLFMNKDSYIVESTLSNPCQEIYGPRGVCYGGNDYLYQVCVDYKQLPVLVYSNLMKIDKNTYKETDRFELSSRQGIIKARGVEIDPRDNNFWITDSEANIYKIAGFDYFNPIIDNDIIFDGISIGLYPNPVVENLNIVIKNMGLCTNANLQIINIYGEVIGTYFAKSNIENTISYTINMKNNCSGVYFVVFCDNNGNKYSKRIVKI